MQPQIIEDNITIAANSTNDNVIVSNSSLKSLQRVPFPCKGTLVCVQGATGLIFSLDYGSKNVVADSNARVGTDLQEPLDVVNDEWYAEPGDMLILRVTNTTGAGIALRYRIRCEPLIANEGDAYELPPDTRVQQRGPVAIAANAVDVQLLSGLKYERPPVPSILRLLMTASAVGLNRQVYVDTDRIAPPSALVPNNRVPQDPFDTSVNNIEVPNDKEIQVPVSNSTAGILNVFWKEKLQEIIRA